MIRVATGAISDRDNVGEANGDGVVQRKVPVEAFLEFRPITRLLCSRVSRLETAPTEDRPNHASGSADIFPRSRIDLQPVANGYEEGYLDDRAR